MAYFFQNRLLRYALSRLDIFEQDDLQRLETSWGRRSTVELRNVGIRKDKLTSLLALPNNIKLHTAKIALLRVTVPADIYASPIVVDINGIESRATIREVETPSSDRDQRKADRATHGTTYDQRSRRQKAQRERVPAKDILDSEEDDEHVLPTTHELAKSFLAEEPLEERKQMEAVINAQPNDLQQSISSNSTSDDDLSTGMGVGLSLPGFIAGFLRDVVDRLQVTIRQVVINLDVELELPLYDNSRASKEPTTILTTLALKIEEVDVDSTRAGSSDIDTEYPTDGIDRDDTGHRLRKRKIRLKDIRGSFVSDSTVFDRISRGLGTETPTKLQSPVNSWPRSKESTGASTPSRTTSPTRQNATRDLSSRTTFSRHLGIVAPLDGSFVSSDAGRFADADEDSVQNSPILGEGRAPFERGTLDASKHSTMQQSLGISSTLDLENSLQYGSPFDDADSEVASESSLARSRDIYHTLRSFRQDKSPRRSNISSSRRSEGGSMYIAADESLNRTPSPPVQSIHHGLDGLIQSNPILEPNDQSDNTELVPQGPTHQDHTISSADSISPAEADLTESTLFSHEDASSIYMSVMDEAGAGVASQRSFRMPGGWDDASEPSSQMQLGSNNNGSQPPAMRGGDVAMTESSVEDQPVASPDMLEKQEDPSKYSNMLVKECLAVDHVDIWIPELHRSSEPIQISTPHNVDSLRYGSYSKAAASSHQVVPGAFSAYAESIPTGSHTDSKQSDDMPALHSLKAPHSNPQYHQLLLEILVNRIHLGADVCVTLMLAQLSKKLQSTLGGPHQSSASQTYGEIAEESTPDVMLQVKSAHLGFLESLNTQSLQEKRESHRDIESALSMLSQEALFAVKVDDIQLSLNNLPDLHNSSILLGSLSIGCLDDDIISFKRESKMRMSLRDPEDLQKHAISIRYGRRGAVSDINISTIPMTVIMDLQRIDDTLGSFGGVSGLLELGSSILSESMVSTASPVIKPRQRSVRFEQQSAPPQSQTPNGSSKINLRMGGSHVALKGKHCTISMHTTAIKVVSRDALVGFQIDDIRLDGPHLVDDKRSPEFRIRLQNLGLKYLFSPDEGDLTRLISLLTPSKDKFEAEDDLLLDTLIRQRRKGAVLRVNIALADVEIDDLAVVQALQDLSLEMSKLSSFAKYLPAETRPGLMTLAMIDAVNLRVDTGVTMGLVSVAARSLDVAHVSAPSLIALGIDTVSADYKDHQRLVSPVLPHTDSNRPLMLMARMIGDELEPTLKVKLWNTCFDYSVPLIIGFMDLNRDQTTEELTVDMATSVLMFADTRKSQAQPLRDSGRSGGDSKPLHLAFDFRECAIGLSPRDLSSKGLFLISDCRFTGALPRGSNIDMSLELRKAELLIIDDIKNLHEPEDIGPPKRGVTFETRTQHLSALCRQGFVSVMSISAATVRLQIAESPIDKETVVDIDIKDELFVLETCADSTQTLGEIFGALLPPMPPSKGVKYRTEVAPIEDMMASFTGDAFATVPEVPSSALEEDDVDYVDNELTADFDDLGDLPDEVETSPTETSYHSEFGSSSRISDMKATHPLISQVEIGELEDAQSVILDGALNPKTMQSQIQGTAHRWDSANNRYIPVSKIELSKSPLRLRIRDMHIIWNLYDGYDWAKTRDTISKAVMDVETKAEERRAGRKSSVAEEEEQESVIGDFLFNSIYIGVSPSQDPRELTRNINRNIDDVISETGSGTSTVTSKTSTTQRAPRTHNRKLRLNRSRRHKIAFELGGTSLDLFLFSQGGETQSSVDIRVRDFEIFDHVPTSTWKKFVTYMHDAGPREDSKAMVHLEICNVRPIPDLTATELVIRASVLPLRLHVDQDALDFMTRFFDFSDNTVKPPTPAAEQVYLQRVEVRPVPIKLDYKPKKVDYGGLRSGRTKEFMNFFILDGADMVLRHAIIYGCSGFDRLHRSLEDVWMPDITRNQLPTVLAGLNGVRTLVNVGQGVRDLVVIPVQEYRRNGRVVRSISKGALAFAKTTGSEITRFGAKLAVGAQNALQGAEGLLVPHQRSGSNGYHDWDADDDDGNAAGDEERRTISRYAHQPANILAGLKGAARSLERDLLVTKDAIVAVAGEVRDSGSAEGAARAVVRGAPTVVLRPMIGASRAAGMALMGAANSVDPENLRRASDKYKKY